jgi:hypothetical protein
LLWRLDKSFSTNTLFLSWHPPEQTHAPAGRNPPFDTRPSVAALTTASGGCGILWIEKMTVKCKQWLTFTQEFELVVVDCDKKTGIFGQKNCLFI